MRAVIASATRRRPPITQREVVMSPAKILPAAADRKYTSAVVGD
jgi:hypothetical protein